MRVQISEKILTDGISKQGYTLYHRTGGSGDPKTCVDAINSIIKNGFKPGSGAMYGKGLYTTTDRKSQFTNDMAHSYGAGVIKIAAPAKGILVLDYNIAGVLFGTGLGKSGYPAYSLVDQLIRFGIFQNDAKIPLILKALSEDLECTWGAANRKLSAQRAYHIFTGCLIDGGSVTSAVNQLSNLPSEIKDFYYSAKINPIKNFDKNPKVNGIVFSGNHDGNVLAAYNYSMLRPLMWGVSDISKANDPKAWIIPLQPVKGAASMASVEDMFSDMLADEGAISPRGSVASFYYEGMDYKTKDKDIVDIKKLASWMGIRSNGFNSLHVALSKTGESFIYEGSWLQGRFEGYFGADKVIMPRVQKIMGKAPPSINFFPEWEMGNFSGKYFSGNFKGGVFEKGTFNGLFSGGVWLYNKDAVWGASAQFISGKNSHFINYEGNLYPLDSDPETWVKKRLAVKNTVGGQKNYVDETIPLFQNIENSFPYKNAKVNTSAYSMKKTLSDSFKDLRDKYNWLWSKGLNWSVGSPPEIHFSNTEAILMRGILVLGRVFFKNYSEAVEITGGVVEEDNTFFGHFRGGIYKKGTFKGNWYGGVWFAKDAKWDSKAKLIPGTTVGSKSLPAETIIVLDSKEYKIVPEAYLTWKSIPELIKAIKDGSYKQLLDSLKVSKKPVGTAASISRIINTAKTVNLTVDELLAIVNDSDDEDDISDLNDSVEFKNSLDKIHDSLAERDLNRKISINEKQFRYRDLSDDEQEMLYQEFKDSYEKATGAAFSFSSFEWRADNWTFFGNPPDDNSSNKDIGGVAVRKQQSNEMFKLVASFGSFRSIMKGFIELNQKYGRFPIWGMVTPNIQKMIVRGNRDFVSLPGVVVKAMEPALKKLSNGEVKSVGLNGVAKVNTPSGVIDKMFVCNKNYIKWLIDMIDDPSMASKIPVPQAVLKPLVGMIKALL